MANNLKCSEYTRIGRPCVSISWASLDKTGEEYAAKVEASEKQLAEVIAQLLREKKTLKQAEERAKKKAICLSNEMREASEDVKALIDDLNCPAGGNPDGFFADDVVNPRVDR
jgi:hypothetical protein